eukprot:CAMPEP_0202885722 /NCGR_PEP_ID=MMETSP1391-20130828/41808_1 /ASSEMBLY_ACC=CAM_ASM_000867 /TAXON_ID=1034604 /ORGANISM="Chlamydomonas leiostraca, Strain SAG 11-49" /LENGTH=417 /DNA_ID=CAMNT_0049568977 /DNA_START=308 /DNA_END=1558 /DNA_ORIENTATION=+
MSSKAGSKEHGAPKLSILQRFSSANKFALRTTLVAALIVCGAVLASQGSWRGMPGLASASRGSMAREREMVALVQTVRRWLADVLGVHKAAGSATGKAAPVSMPPASVLQLAALEQELFCAHIHPLDLPKAKLVTELKVPGLPADFSMYAYKEGDQVSSKLIEDGVWELEIFGELDWAMTTPLPPGATPTSAHTPGLFVDVGANVGVFFLYAAARGFEAVGFEAMRSNQLLIRSSLCASKHGLAQRATLVPFALGKERAHCKLYSEAVNQGDGIIHCAGPNDPELPDKTDNGYVSRGTMSILRLDDVLARDVRALKMDVEGFEPLVFAGAQQLLARHTVWFLLFEHNGGLLRNHIKSDSPPTAFIQHVLDLQTMGYKISKKSFKGPFLTTEEIKAMGPDTKTNAFNLYCVHKRYHEW